MRQTVGLVLASMLLSALAACNTVQGVGRDIESVGTAGKEVIN
ncbi:entericidin [Sphingobium scionense]|jgi:entericidin B|uniref:Putative small secreted protein n=1 Tax=Sphingobium scionense TaxID=1404341 RepID=A0A7W6PU40_9SPHN|nr:entericidin [Sphingobium scionense]MBB4147253.1 putative small secreted protein [Sphingobium scionense]